MDDVADVYHYDCGKSVRFNVAAFSSGIPIEIDSVAYSLCYDKMEPHKQGVLRLHHGVATIEGGTMHEGRGRKCAVTLLGGAKGVHLLQLATKELK